MSHIVRYETKAGTYNCKMSNTGYRRIRYAVSFDETKLGVMVKTCTFKILKKK